MEDIIRIHNGKKVQATFNEQEYQNRQQKLRRLLEAENIEVALFTSIHNINYYTDFLYCSFGRPYGCLITQRSVKTISANIDGGQPWRRTVGDDNVVFTDWQKDNYFKAIKKECQGLRGRIGIEFEHISVERLDKLKAVVPNLEVVDISQQVMELRMIKSAAEIEHISKAAAIADIGGETCVKAIAENVPEHEVALQSTQAMVKEIAHQFPHSELMDTWTWFQSGLTPMGLIIPLLAVKSKKGIFLV